MNSQKYEIQLSESIIIEIKKALIDQNIYGQGCIMINEDGVEHVPIKEIINTLKNRDKIVPIMSQSRNII